jgi:hypothetical protein
LPPCPWWWPRAPAILRCSSWSAFAPSTHITPLPGYSVTTATTGRTRRPSRRHALGVYQIVALLPIEHGEPQYRIKSVTEAHERRASEFDLRVIAASP